MNTKELPAPTITEYPPIEKWQKYKHGIEQACRAQAEKVDPSKLGAEKELAAISAVNEKSQQCEKSQQWATKIGQHVAYLQMSNRLRTARQKLGMTQEEFGNCAGVSKQAAGQWEKAARYLDESLGHMDWGFDDMRDIGMPFIELSNAINLLVTPTPNSLYVLEKTAGVSRDWVVKGIGRPIIETSSLGEGAPHKLAAIAAASNTAPINTPTDKVPLISWVQAGDFQEATDPFQLGDADTWLPCPEKHSDSTFALRVQGESMETEFYNGEIIFVDPSLDANHGDYIVVRLEDDNTATFKQLLIDGGKKYLKAINPNWPSQIIEINGNAAIAGVVISKMKSYR